jgi:hypothetical protein
VKLEAVFLPAARRVRLSTGSSTLAVAFGEAHPSSSILLDPELQNALAFFVATRPCREVEWQALRQSLIELGCDVAAVEERLLSKPCPMGGAG